MKILHITHHNGCALDFDFVCQKLNYALLTKYATWNYNMGHDRANEIWVNNKDFFNSFDIIVVSDTAPLARIFLQNNYEKKLIIWVCNRFDYADQASNDCKFPDNEYYDLFLAAIKNNNIKIYSYTKFEHEYAKIYRNVDWGTETIKPCSVVDGVCESTTIGNKPETFLTTRYHNDNIFMNVKDICEKTVKINIYGGEYNGPQDLIGIKGIIHIPYAWSNLALFENWSIGNVYFIPSKDFLIKMSRQNNFFWSPPFNHEFIESSEWYLSEHKEFFMFFDSWDHLIYLTADNELIARKKQKILEFSKEHTAKTLKQWKDALNIWI